MIHLVFSWVLPLRQSTSLVKNFFELLVEISYSMFAKLGLALSYDFLTVFHYQTGISMTKKRFIPKNPTT